MISRCSSFGKSRRLISKPSSGTSASLSDIMRVLYLESVGVSSVSRKKAVSHRRREKRTKFLKMEAPGFFSGSK